MAAPQQRGFKPDVKDAQVGEILMAYYTRGKGVPLCRRSWR
jgi:hypothetical protein